MPTDNFKETTFNPDILKARMIEIKIQQIQSAIARADRFESKLTPAALNVPMLGSLKIRHLLNNLGAISKNYLECGVHKGGSFCSTIFNNPLTSATAIDCFVSDETNEDDKAQPQFIANASKHVHSETMFTLITNDTFKVPTSDIPLPVDFYYFDAGHSEDEQRMALTYYLPTMADVFIYCCDDYMLPEVRKGTQDGIMECRLKVLFEQEMITHHEYDNESWWRGFYVALLGK